MEVTTLLGGLQVSLNDDGSKLLLGLPYVDVTKDGTTYSGAGNVHLYELSTSTFNKVFDLEQDGSDSSIFQVEGYIGRSVAHSSKSSKFAFSSPGTNKVFWCYLPNMNDPTSFISYTFTGGQSDSDVGSSLAINEDGTIVAYGARNHDDGDAFDKGIVTVQQETGGTWNQLGSVLMGERGEGSDSGNYYVGDQFGTSLALSEKNSNNSNNLSNRIRVLVGSPKSDATGLGDYDYYHGHVELYEIDYITANPSTPWEQVAYDVDGSSAGAKAGTSVAMSAKGDKVIVGAPGYLASSVNGFYEGIVKVYKQDEYSAVPSSIPSLAPSVSFAPSSAPSVTQQPSSAPSVSQQPSLNPSLSSVPSLAPSTSGAPSSAPSVSKQPSLYPSLSSAPSLAPSMSMVPSSIPSAEVDKEFRIISTFGKFGEDTAKDWCLTAFEKRQGSKLHVRPCRSYASRNENLQLWKFTSNRKLTLAGMSEGEYCLKVTFRQLTLAGCGDNSDVTLINYDYTNGSITHTKNTKTWRVGFDPESRFERVRLYRDGTLNDALDKWIIQYSFQFPSDASSIAPPDTLYWGTYQYFCGARGTEIKCVGNVFSAFNVHVVREPTLLRDIYGGSWYSSYTADMVSPLQKVETAKGNFLILDGEGKLYQFPRNSGGTYIPHVHDHNIITSDQRFSDIMSGTAGFCAVPIDGGDLLCWSQASVPPSDVLSSAKLVAQYGNYGWCAVYEDDEVQCTGQWFEDFDKKDVKTALGKTASSIIEVGGSRLARWLLFSDGTVACVGHNRCGLGSSGWSSSKFRMVPELQNVSIIHSSYDSTVVVAGGIPYGYGWTGPSYRKFGDINWSSAEAYHPQDISLILPGDETAIDIYESAVCVYVLSESGVVYVLGENRDNGFGDPSLDNSAIIAGVGQARVLDFNFSS